MSSETDPKPLGPPGTQTPTSTPSAPTRTLEEQRDQVGRFKPGCPAGPGRPKANGVAAALRRLVDPDEVAKFIYGILVDNRGRYTTGDKMWAAREIANRLDGKPTQALAMTVQATVAAGLPEGWEEMNSVQRLAYFDGVRRRALEGQ